MIGSSFLCASSWDSNLQDFSDEMLTVSVFEDCVESFERDSSKLSSCCTTPNDLSCSSSDYEGLAFENFDSILPVADSFISQILEESNPVGFGESDWSSLLSTTECCYTPQDENLALVQNSSKNVKKSRVHLSSKPWSKMPHEEQLQTLHTLSEIVTCHMGIREQIEVIKMIDPSVTISPDDTEFALESSSLNDIKMKRIRDFIQKHGFLLNSKKINSSSANGFTLEKQSRSCKMLSKKASSRTKRRQKKQKFDICTDEDIRQRRKLELHGQKEAQSGLFVYEKVIKKLSNPLEEDEDVNILE